MTRVPPVGERDAAIRELFETTRYVDEDGEPVKFNGLPILGDEHDDDDEEERMDPELHREIVPDGTYGGAR